MTRGFVHEFYAGRPGNFVLAFVRTIAASAALSVRGQIMMAATSVAVAVAFPPTVVTPTVPAPVSVPAPLFYSLSRN